MNITADIISTALAVRKAGMRDIPNILSLINTYAAQGIMLPRTEFEMSENIRDFSVAYSGSCWPAAARSISIRLLSPKCVRSPSDRNVSSAARAGCW